MLIRFSVTNFRSISDKMEISLQKTGLKGLESNIIDAGKNHQLLKSAIIYGANASGKSNFLRAFAALDYLVKDSGGFKPGEKIKIYEPHRLEMSFTSLPTSFEIEFIHSGVKYDFYVSFDNSQILKEELYHYPDSAKNILYSRIAGKEIKFGETYRGGKKTIEKLLLNNQLFLTKAAENNAGSLLQPYQFFLGGLGISQLFEEHKENLTGQAHIQRLAEEKNSLFTRRFNSLISALDTGINGVLVEEIDWNKHNLPNNLPDNFRNRFQDQYKYIVKTLHPLFSNGVLSGMEEFTIEDESAGTKSLFLTGGIILEALETGKVLVIDEFEKNLHPGITQYLIKLFNSPLTNTTNAQLIIATHDITQLSNDNFRRDQIWFAEKNETGSTTLYRCSDIKGIRLGTPIDKWYASGRLGASPVINDLDFLIEMQHDKNQEAQ